MQSNFKYQLQFLTLAALCSVILSQAVYAKEQQGFHYELFLTYDNTEDESGIYTLDQSSLGISIFEGTVGYGDYPYLLTNFFERQTHLDFSYLYSKAEYGSTQETTGDLYQVNYSFASVSSPVLFHLGASRLVGEGTDSAGDFDLDATIYNFGFGYYVSPNSVARLSISIGDYVIGDDVLGDIDYDDNHYEGTWQHVRKIDNEQYIAVLLDVEYIEIGSSKNSNVGGTFDFYINRKVGFGAGYTAHRGDYGITEGATAMLRASAFLDEKFGFVAQISRLYADLAGSDEDNIYIKAIARF